MYAICTIFTYLLKIKRSDIAPIAAASPADLARNGAIRGDIAYSGTIHVIKTQISSSKKPCVLHFSL